MDRRDARIQDPLRHTRSPAPWPGCRCGPRRHGDESARHRRKQLITATQRAEDANRTCRPDREPARSRHVSRLLHRSPREEGVSKQVCRHDRRGLSSICAERRPPRFSRLEPECSRYSWCHIGTGFSGIAATLVPARVVREAAVRSRSRQRMVGAASSLGDGAGCPGWWGGGSGLAKCGERDRNSAPPAAVSPDRPVALVACDAGADEQPDANGDAQAGTGAGAPAVK